MPTQVTIDAYTFAELVELADDPMSDVRSDAAQSARDTLCQWAIDYGWWTYTVDYWTDELAKCGFDNADIQFSGFCSQGDGASFTADIDLEVLIPAMAKAGYSDHSRVLRLNHWGGYEPYLLRSHASNYYHSATVSVESLNNHFEGKRANDIMAKFERELDDFRIDLCSKIYTALEAEHDWLCSDEHLIDMAEVNDYRFDAQGRII